MNNFLVKFQPWWKNLSTKDQFLVKFGSYSLLILGIFFVLLLPAYRTIEHTKIKLPQLQQQLILTNDWLKEAQQLSKLPPMSNSEKITSFSSNSKKILADKGNISSTDTSISVTIKQINSTQLVQWLEAIRLNARLLPHETNLQRSSNYQWSGTVIFKLAVS